MGGSSRIPTAGWRRLRIRRLAATHYLSRESVELAFVLALQPWLAMPPASHEYHGHEEIAAFLRASARWRRHRRMLLVPTGANSQQAFGCYLPGSAGEPPQPTGVIVLTTRRGKVQNITRFLDADLPRLFGLPEAVLVDLRTASCRGVSGWLARMA